MEYCSRPFADVHEMDEALIKNWNDRVRPEDLIYHLGDFAMGPTRGLQPLVERLNGYKVLVRGNHDRSRTAMLAAGFDEVVNELVEELEGVKLYMRHYPSFSDHGTDLVLCGHVHTHWRRRGNTVNVGVDVHGFRPVTLQELLLTEPDPPGTIDEELEE